LNSSTIQFHAKEVGGIFFLSFASLRLCVKPFFLLHFLAERRKSFTQRRKDAKEK
jgi:hypothetical protein